MGEGDALTRTPSIVNRDWSSLTFREQVRQLEVEGNVVLPGMLTPDQVAQLHETPLATLGQAISSLSEPNDLRVNPFTSW